MLDALPAVLSRALRAGALGALGAALIAAGAISPAWAASGSGDRGSSAVVGGFGIGDRLEASVDERDGAFAFDLPVGGVQLRWDSRAASIDRYGFGARWSIGLASVDVVGGVRVAPSSGGVYEADASQSSGLAGYDGDDVRFEQASGIVPGPGQEATGYDFVLHELGGVVTYFNGVGDAIARRDAGEAWVVWEWDAEVTHRLTGFIGAEGVQTQLDWRDPRSVRVRPGTNVSAAGTADGVGGEWVIELDGESVSGVRDPLGARVQVRYTDAGLVASIGDDSGAVTAVTWQEAADAVARASGLRTYDSATGEVLSERTWRAAGAPTGWPRQPGADLAASGYSTVLSDGHTQVESEYNGLHQLIRRALRVSGPGGDRIIREHRMRYPSTDDEGVPTGPPHTLPRSWSLPSLSETTITDATGGKRTLRERSAFDRYGRLVERTAIDGTVTRFEYDEVVPVERRLPIGLPVVERVLAPDGGVTETRRAVNEWRTAPAMIEEWSGRDGAPLERVGYAEYESGADGFVTEQRVFPGGDAEAAPLISRWSRTVEVAAGIASFFTEVGAGERVQDAPKTTAQTVSLVHGAKLSETDAVGNVDTFGFDLAGRLVEQIDAAGRRIAVAYESQAGAGRNAVTVTTPDGVERSEERDALGRVRRITDNVADGTVVPGQVRLIESREYPAPGEVVVTDAWGAATTQWQDVLGRTVATRGPTGLTQVIEYDDVAGVQRTGMSPTGRLADAELVAEERTDVSGRPVETTGIRADGRPVPRVRTGFDGFGRPAWSSDGVRDARIEYDLAGNAVTSTIDPSTRDGAPIESAATAPGALRAERRFDGLGNSLEKVLSAGDTDSRSGGSRSLDALGRTELERDQLGRESRYTYTVDGLIARAVMGSGEVREVEYDPETRQVTAERVTSPGHDPVATAFDHDELGRVQSVFDPEAPDRTRLRYRYDALGNVLAVTYPDGAEIRHEYDLHGRQIALIDVAGNRTEFVYDEAGRVRSTARTRGDGRGARVDYEYDAYGRIDRVAHGNGLVVDYAFTSASEIARETATIDGRPATERQYEYDLRGNLIQRTDTRTREVGGDRAAGDPATTTTVYEYDLRDRLIASAVHAGDSSRAPVSSRVEYELTVSGDVSVERATRSESGAEHTTSRAFEYSPLGELTAVTTMPAPGEDPVRVQQTYDNAGNLVRDVDGVEYHYDAANRLTAEITSAGEVTRTTYWPDGSRRARLDERSGRTATFYWDGPTLINDVHTGPDPAGADALRDGIASYLLGAGRHARITSATAASTPEQVEYVTTDRHGSVTELTDVTGTITAQYDYADYGSATLRRAGDAATVGLARNPFGFAGEFTDESGHLYLQARMYHPDVMRFAGLDTLALHNRASFADANPIMRIDPSGHASEDDVTYVLVAALGVVLGVAGIAVSAGMSVVALGFSVIATAVDVGAMTAEIVNRLHDRFMSSEQEAALAWVAFGVGLAAAALGSAVEIARAAKAARSGAALASDTSIELGNRASLTEPLLVPSVKVDPIPPRPYVPTSVEKLLDRVPPRLSSTLSKPEVVLDEHRIPGFLVTMTADVEGGYMSPAYRTQVIPDATKILESRVIDRSASPFGSIMESGLWRHFGAQGLPPEISASILFFVVTRPSDGAIKIAREVPNFLRYVIGNARMRVSIIKAHPEGASPEALKAIANHSADLDASTRLLAACEHVQCESGIGRY